MTTDALLLTRALHFAAQRHVDQRRKGTRGEPYLNHLAEVAHLVAEATGGEDAPLVAAALLHDTVEDTPTTRDEIEAEFGADVAALVMEVTDDKSLPKDVRKRLQVEKAPGKSKRARILKTADKTSNLLALAASPPADWDLDRLRAYVQWGRDVVAALGKTGTVLDGRFEAAAEAADREFGVAGSSR